MLHYCSAKKTHSAAFQLLTIEYMHTLPFDPVEVYTPSGHYYLWHLILVDISKLETNLIFHTCKNSCPSNISIHSSTYSPGSHSQSAVADLGFLEGGRVQVQPDYCNSTHCYIMPGKGSGSTLALAFYVYANFQNLGSLRSHLLAIQALSPCGHPDLFRCPYIICIVMFIDILLTSHFKEKVVMGVLIASFFCSWLVNDN